MLFHIFLVIFLSHCNPSGLKLYLKHLSTFKYLGLLKISQSMLEHFFNSIFFIPSSKFDYFVLTVTTMSNLLPVNFFAFVILETIFFIHIISFWLF